MQEKSEYRKKCEEYKPIALKKAKEDILKNSKMTSNGKLTPRFKYLSDYVV